MNSQSPTAWQLCTAQEQLQCSVPATQGPEVRVYIHVLYVQHQTLAAAVSVHHGSSISLVDNTPSYSCHRRTLAAETQQGPSTGPDST